MKKFAIIFLISLSFVFFGISNAYATVSLSVTPITQVASQTTASYVDVLFETNEEETAVWYWYCWGSDLLHGGDSHKESKNESLSACEGGMNYNDPSPIGIYRFLIIADNSECDGYLECKNSIDYYGSGDLEVYVTATGYMAIPVASTSDLFASAGTLITDLWILLAVAMGVPLGFYVIPKIIALII